MRSGLRCGWITLNGSASVTINITEIVTLIPWYVDEALAPPDNAVSVLIRTQAELAAVSGNLNATYSLMNSIVLTGGWTPIGTEAQPFTGRFYGNGHTISGLAPISGMQYAGLFGVVKGTTAAPALITDLTVDYNNATITLDGSSEMCFGGIAGWVQGAAEIRRVRVSGDVTVRHTEASILNAGGAVGSIKGTYIDGDYDSSTLDGLTVTANLTVDPSNYATHIGGIVGITEGDISSSNGIRLLNSRYKDGVIKLVAADGEDQLGGVAGNIAPNVSLEGCSSAAVKIWLEKTGSGIVYVGGFAGMIYLGVSTKRRVAEPLLCRRKGYRPDQGYGHALRRGTCGQHDFRRRGFPQCRSGRFGYGEGQRKYQGRISGSSAGGTFSANYTLSSMELLSSATYEGSATGGTVTGTGTDINGVGTTADEFKTVATWGDSDKLGFNKDSLYTSVLPWTLTSAISTGRPTLSGLAGQ
jgi:hypothetical protein